MSSKTSKNVNAISRRDAAAILDEVAEIVAKVESGEFGSKKLTAADVAQQLRVILTGFDRGFASRDGVIIPTKCNGEAHSNPHIDHCGVCMPNWGWITRPTKVK